jgi:hypothetical protein
MKMKSRRAEVICALAVTITGLGGIAILLFGPIYPAEMMGTDGLIHFRVGLATDGQGHLVPLWPTMVLPLSIASIFLIVLTIGAIFHSCGISSGRLILWGATVVLFIVVTIASVPDLGAFVPYLWIALLPSLVLTLVTLWIAMFSAPKAQVRVADEPDDD